MFKKNININKTKLEVIPFTYFLHVLTILSPLNNLNTLILFFSYSNRVEGERERERIRNKAKKIKIYKLKINLGQVVVVVGCVLESVCVFILNFILERDVFFYFLYSSF